MSLLYLVKWQHLESCYLYWQSESLCQHYFSSHRWNDRSLTFNAHLKKLTASLTSSIHIIGATAHASSGLCLSTRKKAFHALVHSKLDYTAPAWQPWLSDTNLSCLDRLQNRSLWLITGQLVSTPLKSLRLEANVQSYPILKAKHRQNIIHFPSPLWQQSPSHKGRIATSVPGITDQAEDNNLKQQRDLSTIASYQAD